MPDNPSAKNPYYASVGYLKADLPTAGAPSAGDAPGQAPGNAVGSHSATEAMQQPDSKGIVSPEEGQAGPQGLPRGIRKGAGMLPKAIGIVVVIVVIALLYLFVLNKPSAPSGPTTVVASLNINSCSVISNPGSYYIVSNISTTVTNGTCIKITSSNVNLQGSGHAILGSGPFVQHAPYSYGLFIGPESNVTVSGLVISKFSYGAYLNGTSHSELYNMVVKNATVSGIYLNNGRYDTVYSDGVSGTVARFGGIDVSGGGNNTFASSSSNYNAYYGMSLSNSTGNQVYNSVLLGNPIDIVCASNSSFKSSNRFSNTTCFVNNGCNFASCSQINTPYNVTQTYLSGSIDECGGINRPGTYTLTGNLNLQNYVNTSLAASSSMPCIYVNASNVGINCNGYTISNAYYGLFALGRYNVSASDCNFVNGTYGVYVNNTTKFSLYKVNAYGNTYGIYVFNSTDGNVTAINTKHNSYGYYINQTTYLTSTGFTSTNNTYGVAIDNSSSLYFYGITATSNSRIDLYCSANAYNSTSMTFSQGKCGSTDCNWAPECPIKFLPGLSAYPITACTTITLPGDYELQNNLVASGTCIDIKTGGVSLDCNKKTVTGNGDGIAFYVQNATNVALTDCSASGFSDGIYAENAGHITVQSSSLSSVNGGVLLSNSSYSQLIGDSVSTYADYAFSLSRTDNSTITNDYAHSGGSTAYGFILNGSSGNHMQNDTSNVTGYGFYIESSLNNLISNNLALASVQYDYYCDAASGSITSQAVEANNGETKSGCRWLVVVPTVTHQQTCQSILGASTISLSQDLVYPYGSDCFDVYSSKNASASGTVINCNGHTILATDGGGFVYSQNTGSVKVENCLLVGFSNPLAFISSKQVSGIVIMNNTILDSGTAIYMNNTQGSTVTGNRVMGSNTIAVLVKFNDSELENNVFQNSASGVYINSSSSSQLLNNTLSNVTAGIRLSGYTGFSFGKNRITDSHEGFVCSGSTAQDVDLGENVCPVATGCDWLTSASPSCANS